jgi:putative CocE/NonD family hydrolase
MFELRDGTKLHTIIFFPRDYETSGKTYTAITDRSPYGYGDMEWIPDIFLPFGYVAIGQDMRGTEKSEGNFSMFMSDSEDAIDLGDWIVAQNWSNGQVYTFGASADGIGSLQVPVHNPSWLMAQYIAWCPANLYNILFPGGAYKQKLTEDWIHGLAMPIPEVADENIEDIHEQENGLDPDFWPSVDVGPEVWKNVHARNAFWSGWYDVFQVETFKAFDGYNTYSDESVRGTSVMTVDPLGHCLEGAEYFPQNAVEGRTAVMIGQLFDIYGIRPVTRSHMIKSVTFYVMSSNDDAGLEVGQYWTSLETFPAPKMTDYYFHGEGTATTNVDGDPNAEDLDSTSFKYDPADPVPTYGGNNLPPDIGGSIPCGPWDQTPADQRDDVLKFQTTAVEEPLYLTGPMFSTLYVSSDAIDTDFTIKISDVYPTGEARILQDSAVRMRWREASAEPIYMEIGQVYEVEVMLWNTSYVVAPGHALRFSVSSSNFPRFSVNPNNGLLLADPIYPGDNITAVNTLYHSPKYPSRVKLPIVDKSQLPMVHVLKEMQESYPELLNDSNLKKYNTYLQQKLRNHFRHR